MKVDLANEFRRLNLNQQEAILHQENTAVLAGPGSGKTDTLVIKVAHLLSEVIKPPRGIACITFNNDAVHEFRQRLAKLGYRENHHLFLGTVHSFCLNAILRPFAHLALPQFSDGIRVAPPSEAKKLLSECINRYIPDARSGYDLTITRYRRQKSCHEDVSGYDDRDELIVQDYLMRLRTQDLVDFEEIIAQALLLLEIKDWVGDFLCARFPWLIVDEYQDLGGPLHRIIVHLIEKAGISVFAVGDPDQTVYDFTGAKPKYLLEFANRSDVKLIQLRFNYRSGKRLIVASEAALGDSKPRNYQPDPKRKDLGEVHFYQTSGDYISQAECITKTILPFLDKQNIPRHEIALFYRQPGNLLGTIKQSLSNIPYVAERDGPYPRSPFVRWLQKCVIWSRSPFGNIEVSFEDLLPFFVSLRQRCGLDTVAEGSFESRRILYSALSTSVAANTSLRRWLAKIDKQLQLQATLAGIADEPDTREDFETLLRLTGPGGRISDYTVSDFARDGRLLHQLVITTYHSSKGRQFDAVILAGLQEGTFPRRPWNRRQRQYAEPAPAVLYEDRRLFYVGFTRARKFVFLVYSPWVINDYGYRMELGPSRFVQEIKKRLDEVKFES